MLIVIANDIVSFFLNFSFGDRAWHKARSVTSAEASLRTSC